MKQKMHWVSFFILGLYILLAFGSSDDSSSNSQKTEVSKGSDRIIGSEFPGCASREYFDKLISMSSQGDKEAFSKLLSVGLLNGNCILLKPGSKIFVEDTALLSGIVKVRIKGKLKSYWTNMEALNK